MRTRERLQQKKNLCRVIVLIIHTLLNKGPVIMIDLRAIIETIIIIVTTMVKEITTVTIEVKEIINAAITTITAMGINKEDQMVKGTMIETATEIITLAEVATMEVSNNADLFKTEDQDLKNQLSHY
jgi:ABC-type antimicrobial peptide transport system permease subunit